MQDVGKPVHVDSQNMRARKAIRHSLSVAGWAAMQLQMQKSSCACVHTVGRALRIWRDAMHDEMQ